MHTLTLLTPYGPSFNSLNLTVLAVLTPYDTSFNSLSLPVALTVLTPHGPSFNSLNLTVLTVLTPHGPSFNPLNLTVALAVVLAVLVEPDGGADGGADGGDILRFQGLDTVFNVSLLVTISLTSPLFCSLATILYVNKNAKNIYSPKKSRWAI